MITPDDLPPDEAALLAELEATFSSPDADSWCVIVQLVGPDWPGWYVRSYGPPCDILPWREGQTKPGRGIRALVIRAGIVGSPIALERRLLPGLPDRVGLVGLDQPHSQAHVTAAVAGIPLIAHATELPQIGRRRLKDSPSSPGRAYAEQATEMMQADSTLTVKAAAARLLVDYEALNDDPIAEKKAERAAEARLHRYLRTFRRDA